EIRQLLHRINQWGETLDSHFEAVTGFYRTNAAGSACENDVAGHEGHVGGDEADQVVAIENQLACILVLAQLAVFEKLDGEMMRVDLGFDVWTEGSKGVEGLGTRPLAFAILDGAIADVLGGCVAKDIASGCGRSDVANAPANNNAQLSFKVCAMVGK